MKVSIKKLWEQIAEKQDALITENNYGESFEALCDLIQYLDENQKYEDEVLVDLIKANNINMEEVTE